MIPFITGDAPIVPEPIQIVIEAKIEIPEQPEQPEEPKEPTLQEKIATNFYECDESIEYIRADNAKCLPRYTPSNSPQTRQSTNNTTQSQSTVRTAEKPSSGWFPYGQCTYYVWSMRSVGKWNNASDWLWQAQRDGYATGSTPRVGAIAWEPGHVSYVTAVHNDGTITVSEMNYQGWGVISTRTAPASNFKYIY